MNRPLCVLIDGNALAYRAFYAFKQPLINSKGEHTTIAYVFLNVFKKIIENYSPDYFGVMFDLGKPRKRLELYKEYKAQRKKMPEEMYEQLPALKKIIKKLEIPIYEIEGVEADDIMGKVAKEGEKKGMDVYILTSDKDMCQIVNEHIKIIRPGRGTDVEKLFGIKEVYEKYSVYPNQIVDYLSIVGDSSDNIPGVRGIGEKGAVKLLHEFGSLKDIYEKVDQIKTASIKKKLLESEEQAILAKKLILLDEDFKLDISWDLLKYRGFKHEAMVPVLKKLEFGSMIRQFDIKSSFDFDFFIVDSDLKMDNLLKKIKAHEEIAIDIESDSLDPFQARLIGISICFRDKEGYYLPFGHKEGVNLSKKNMVDLEKALKNKKMIGQNIKYDYLVLRNNGFILHKLFFDTMIASYLINPDQSHHNLDSLAERWLGYKMKSYKELIKEENAKDFSEVNIEQAAFYSVEDVVVTLHVKKILEKKIEEVKLEKLFNEIEMPLVKILADVEANGIFADVNKIEILLKKHSEESRVLENEIYEKSGEKFNIKSTKQLSDILFNKLNLPTGKKTKTGYSTDVKVLEKLAKIHEVPKMILEFRQLTKLISTYLEPMKILAEKNDGIIHASFNQSIAATGRLTCSSPNLQNIPIKTERGKQIRTIFISGSDENVLISADYSQIELRVMAHLSGDENLISAFEKGEDIHREIAARIYDMKIDDISSEMRRRAKTINFGVLYGMGAYSLSKELNITNKEAKDFIEKYFSRFPGINGFIEKTILFAEESGYVSTLFNRRRYVPDINSSNRLRKEFAKRIAVNTPVQGSAADIIKKAMIDIQSKINKEKLPLKMILQVHDELLFESPKTGLEKNMIFIKKEMENCVALRVPLKVDAGYGNNWLEAH